MARLRPCGARGYTLVELLVTMSVIALLMSLLLPAMGRARKSAHRTMCLSNQHQIGTAVGAYIEDADGFYPIAYFWIDDDGQRVDHPSVNEAAWDTITIRGVSRPGLLWQYAIGSRVQQCPTFAGNSNTPADRFTGYNYNTSYIGRGAGEGSWGGMTGVPAKVDQVANPSDTALIGDGGYRDGANKYMRAPGDRSPLGLWGVHAGAQAFRHAGTTNVAWGDGHGTTRGEAFRHAAATAAHLALQGWPEHGFLGDGDDLYDRR